MKILKSLTVLALVPALALGPIGCETMKEHKTASGAAIGAGTGAVLGGVIGHQSGNKTQGALIGAAAGALIGGGTGYWLDRRSKKFEQVEDQHTSVETVPAATYETPQGTQQPVQEHIVLRLNDTLLFARGSSAISPMGIQKLDEIAQLLNESTDERIDVRGYASSEGQDAANMTLSENRAKSVANYLRSRVVNPSRINHYGMGISKPIASNDTEAGRAQNRRVEIEVFPGPSARQQN